MKHFNFIKGFLLALMFVFAAQVKAETYTVAEAFAAYENGGVKAATVKGYIVGVVDGSSVAKNSKFTAETEIATNLLLADNADETDPNNCLPVQLPKGAVREALNLVAHPENYGQFVALTGSIEKYFSVAGLKNVTEYSFEGAAPEQPEEPEEPETPVEPETPAGVYISEALTSSFGTFTTQETVGNYPWEIATQYQCAKVTGYKGSANAAESWMVSKSFDLSKETAAYISFDYVIAYNSDDINECHKVVFSHDYAGDVSKATWKEIDYSPVKSGVWTLENTGKIAIPSEMYGKENVVVAFKYTSSASNASTWEVKNVVVASGTGNVPVEPEQPETPEEPETLVCTVTEALAAFVAGEAKPAVVKGYIVGSIDGKSIDDANFSGTAVSATNLLIADDADETDITKCLAVQLPSGAVRSALNLVDNPGNYKKLVSLTGSLEKYFGVAGLKSVKEYSFDGDAPVEPEQPEQPEEPETPETLVCSVTEALAAFVAGEAKPAVVKGYIVGSIDGKSIDDANFSGTATANTNLLIADDADETDITKCLAVQLPSGAVRSALNLVDNPGNYKKLVSLTGSLEKYFGVAGLKSVKEYSFDGDAPVEPEQPEEPETPVEPEIPEVVVGENILLNSGFEEWNDGALTAWGKDGSNASAHSATIAQSTDADSDIYAVEVAGASENKRLASKAYTLPAGTYSLSAFIKQSGDVAGAFRLGYAVIKDGAIAYHYLNEATYVTEEYEKYAVEFTLEEETTVSVLVMNSKVGNGASILVDNVKLIALSTTAIEVTVEDSNAEPLYYDLSGRVVKNPANGIYICNGKKVLVK